MLPSSSMKTYLMSDESSRICPSGASNLFALRKNSSRRPVFPTMPIPFIAISIVSNFSRNVSSKKFIVRASIPRSFITFTESSDMSMATTSCPRSISIALWQPEPAPTSSTLPRHSSMAFCSCTGISSKVRNSVATGISSS